MLNEAYKRDPFNWAPKGQTNVKISGKRIVSRQHSEWTDRDYSFLEWSLFYYLIIGGVYFEA